ncbi:MAG: hypothetical protein DDG59_03610 [Anaerolineae bacterium]|jgi:hypothetical protein|nr:MAG: hypothetical protein DDG59_03610 [Anaerolineae bacterium]
MRREEHPPIRPARKKRVELALSLSKCSERQQHTETRWVEPVETRWVEPVETRWVEPVETRSLGLGTG